MSRCCKKLKIPIFHAYGSGTIETEARKYPNDVWISFKVGRKTQQYHQTISPFGPLAAAYSPPRPRSFKVPLSVRPPTSQPVSLQLAAYNRLCSRPWHGCSRLSVPLLDDTFVIHPPVWDCLTTVWHVTRKKGKISKVSCLKKSEIFLAEYQWCDWVWGLVR